MPLVMLVLSLLMAVTINRSMDEAQAVSSYFKKMDSLYQHVLYEDLKQRYKQRREKPVQQEMS